MVRPILAAAFSLLIASPAALAADTRQMEENKKIVAAFYDAAVNQKDFEKALQYLGARYTPAQSVGGRRPRRLQELHHFLEGQVPEQPQRDQAHLRRRRLRHRPCPCRARAG